MIASFYSVNLIAQLIHVNKTTISNDRKRYQMGIFSKKDKTIGKYEISKDEVEQLRYSYPHLSDKRIAEIVSKDLGIQISRAMVNSVEHLLCFRFLP